MLKEDYAIEKDTFVKDYFEEKDDLREDTVKSYRHSLKQFSIANEETITDIIEKCKEQQKSKMEKNGQITEFNPNDPNSLIKQYINNFKDYCIGKGNKNSTINDKMDNILVFLNHYKVKTPRRKRLENDRKKWYKLSKEDVRYILKDCNIVEQSLITFMLSTGLRRWDVAELTIGDFMEATRKMEYHNFVEVDDFIDNAPDDMIGFWDLIPHKESKNEIPCKTFNSPESSNLILQNLRRIKNVYHPNKLKKDKIELKLEKSDALFGSRKKHYKESLTKESMTNAIRSKNPRFKEWKIKQIDEAIKNKKISKEDREKEIDKIPTINPHALRKIFTNAVDTHGGLSLRANLLMEGHSSEVSTDTHYIQKDKEELFKGYRNILPYLTIMEDIDVRILTNEEGEELNNKVIVLEADKKSLEKTVEKLEKIIENQAKELKNRQEEFEKEINERVKNIPTDNPTLSYPIIHTKVNSKEEAINFVSIINFISNCVNKKEDLTALDKQLQSFTDEEIIVIREISCEISLHDRKYRETGEIKQLIQKAIAKVTRNPQLLQGTSQFNENEKKRKKYSKILDEEIKEFKFFEENELEDICDDILLNFNRNVEKIKLDEITTQYVRDDIDKYLDI